MEDDDVNYVFGQLFGLYQEEKWKNLALWEFLVDRKIATQEELDARFEAIKKEELRWLETEGQRLDFAKTLKQRQTQ